MLHGKRHPDAFTLLELLIVISLMSILASLIIPRLEPTIDAQLQGAAQVVAADLAYARSLAVTNNSSYQLSFDAESNRYVLAHSGANTLLDDLPRSPFRRADDPADKQTTDLDELPRMGLTVRLLVVHKANDSLEVVGDLQFGPLGGTSRPEETVVWLTSGAGRSQRYLSLRVDPVTGLVSIGQLTATAPTVSGG